MMTKISETQIHSFHAYAGIKQCLHISKVHLEVKELMNKSKKTAPSWSYILTHLVAIDKFLEIWLNLCWSKIEPYVWRSCNSQNAPNMDQQLFVVGVPRHLVTIRGQMVLSAFGSIALFKFRYFELGRYDQVRDQA